MRGAALVWVGLAGACGPAEPAAPPTDTAVSSDGTAADGADGTSGDGADGGSDGTGGTEPALPQPLLFVPADAEDLDPEPGVVRIALRAASQAHSFVDWRSGETWTVEGYAYNEQLPGPTIRAQVGDTVFIELDNALEVPTTIHWHGLDVPFEMDGVTWGSAPIGPGETFVYSFVVDQVGTFWYHPHFDTARQVDHGLYGLFIVEDPAEPAVTREVPLVVDDWTEHALTSEDPDVVHGAHGEVGRFTVNGQVQPRLEVVGGESLRLRVLNAMNHGYVDLELDGAQRIAGGQGLLGAAAATPRVVVPPGDRAEWVVRPSETDLLLLDHPYTLHGGAGVGDPAPLLDLVVVEPGPAAPALAWDFGGASPSADPGTTDVVYVFQGEPHTNTWRMNGEAFPDITLQRLDLGQDAVIEVRNVSATEHPFHLHGLTLELLSLDGVVPTHRTVVDTLNLPVFSVARFRVVADNPGFWMAHCHILPHAHGGMMSVLEVSAP